MVSITDQEKLRGRPPEKVDSSLLLCLANGSMGTARAELILLKSKITCPDGFLKNSKEVSSLPTHMR
jgi:hypothetical protein